MTAKGLLLVLIDIDPEYEEEFNRWYTEEHFPPERVRCPGFLTARRFVSVEGEPKYLALYDLDDPRRAGDRGVPPDPPAERVDQEAAAALHDDGAQRLPRDHPPTSPEGHEVHAVRSPEA